MTSLRRFLFKSEIVSLMLIGQAIIDGLIIVFMINFLVENNYVALRYGTETLALVSWSFVTLWAISILIVSMIFGISIVNKFIFYKQIFLAVIIYGLLQVFLFGVGKISLMSSNGISLIFGSTATAILLYRSILFFSYKVFTRFNPNQRVIIIGCNYKAEMLHKSLLKNHPGVQFRGFFDQYDPDNAYFNNDFKGYLEEVKQFALEHKVTEIYYALSNNKPYLDDLTDFTDQHFIFLGILPDVEMKERRRVNTAYVQDIDIPIITYRYSPLQNKINFLVKRTFDILFSSTLILILGPIVLPLIALAIRLDSPGPIFFVQKRPGRNTRLFDCYKFRTMRVNNETEKAATRNDSRITKVGAFLRKTSLDELPQFFNVLKGDMSIVGPRPNLITHLTIYGSRTRDYSLRHIVTPGITGYAQVSGYRGEITDHMVMDKRIEYDMKYMLNWSLAMDIKIIAKTVLQVFTGDAKAY